MRIRRCSATLLLLLSAGCGTIRYDSLPRNCNPMDQAWDNPISRSNGWQMPRGAWWLLYPILVEGVAVALEHATPLSPAVSVISSSLALGVAPHVVGYAQGAYGVNVKDWEFDALDRALPAVWTLSGKSAHAWVRPVAMIATVAATAVLSCHASP